VTGTIALSDDGKDGCNSIFSGWVMMMYQTACSGCSRVME
jgi:hypothetical protein